MVMLASGVAELVSLGSVLPFLGVLSDPNSLWQQPQVNMLAAWLGVTEANQLLIPATVFFVVAAVLAALIRLSNLWLNGRLAAAVGSDLSINAYRRTLYQPYEVHIQSNSSDLITGIAKHINLTVVALNNFLQLITSSIVVAGLMIGLLWIDAPVAGFATIVFGSAYGGFAMTARRELRSNSHKIAAASTLQIKALQEGLGAIRDVLLDGSQSTYLDVYRVADIPQRRLQVKNIFLGALPRYSLEALAMVSVALFGGVLMYQRGSGAAAIPLLGALALGAQRLLPAMQQVYKGWASLKGQNAAIYAVLNMLDQPLPPIVSRRQPLNLVKQIRFEKVAFRYSCDHPEVLCDFSLDVRFGERIGLIGTSGSGKSTILDLLMGLLKPNRGYVLVDGENLHDPKNPERLAAWQMAIAHVPQTVFLTDSTIAENIAFGLPRDKIDLERVKEAAEQAQIADFIECSLDGYDSFVGERGVRLSGGQRQRIGIARALYKRASVIILDEATSALDISTEEAVMESVEGLSRNLTLVMIAHRLSTVQRCDRIVQIAQGNVLADGPPNKMLFNTP